MTAGNVLGIRRETKNRWERRAPLAPGHVAQLVREHGVRILVEPSPLRVFPDQDYVAAGAELAEDLSPCRVILGVKEIPPAALLPRRTYLYFAHVIKGQPENMPALARHLELGSTLVDYERVTDRQGRRLIFFSRHAGYAGAIDALWALGQRLMAEGLRTPLAEVRRALAYSNLDEALRHLTEVGDRIRRIGLPAGVGPLVLGVMGRGSVAQGVWEVISRLPLERVEPEELAQLAAEADRPPNLVYGVTFDRAHRLERAGGGFDAAELADHPERYRSIMDRWLPSLTVLFNAVYWEPGQPVLVSREQLAALLGRGRTRLRVIADITCDIGGSVEATVRATDPGDPVYVYDPFTGDTAAGVEGRGVVVLA
ncbi:MAG TPA: hypothetical protein ENK19_08535, partial [Acidobacteria bacterium]|nr:hypothetical protein [Acidobacteriota bacterium]